MLVALLAMTAPPFSAKASEHGDCPAGPEAARIVATCSKAAWGNQACLNFLKPGGRFQCGNSMRLAAAAQSRLRARESSPSVRTVLRHSETFVLEESREAISERLEANAKRHGYAVYVFHRGDHDAVAVSKRWMPGWRGWLAIVAC